MNSFLLGLSQTPPGFQGDQSKNELDVTHMNAKANICNTSTLQSIHGDSQPATETLMPSPIIFNLLEGTFLYPN